MSTQVLAAPAAIQSVRFQKFIQKITDVVSSPLPEAEVLQGVALYLKTLVRNDDWLPAEYAEADLAHYRQYLLYADPADRFSVVSFVWGPNQKTPIHDHTTWGVSGVLRGGEALQGYKAQPDSVLAPEGRPVYLFPGTVEVVSPEIGDLHESANAFDDRISVSIHVYGANIGKVERHIFDRDGSSHKFVSRYSDAKVSQSIVELRA